MKASRYVVMGVAAIAAILLAFLVRGMIAGGGAQEAKATVDKTPAVATARVLIAARELKAGTRISEADLTWQEWPVASLNAAYIVDGGMPAGAPGMEGAAKPAADKPKSDVEEKVGDVTQAVADKIAPSPTKEAYVGGVAREDILANEPIIDAKIVRSDEGGFMAVMLQPGMRALAVPVSVDNTAGGFILPGDRVDILVTHQLPSATGRGTIDSVQPVLRNIRVLAIDQSVAAEQDKQTVIGATATLEVSPGDGQVVTLAKASGTLSLMLRSYADAQGPSGAVTTSPTGGASEDLPVRVYRNGQATEVTVSR
ncbi:flp pilus assembly protein CpaB [Asticcacaulis biprosthecium C19]|uniref:Flp pilus assembly protein CpaB n=1 Tax=Asticcacaulis biprosthecium C19 TaxID=715226 RepID=F4QJ53_9CAUL|nr:Flp pilus assembly protein CpaB [Asticcacaulis biprosthecium]EGF91884.1 flp pilus assembly protein CpaB [Asticcacaulis biprosthecium C19]